MIKEDPFKEYYKTKNIDLRNRLVEEHLYMVDILIKKYLGKGIEKEDLHQVGALALISAVERFNPNKGYQFSSFATPTILGEIKKHFRDKGWSVKVPRRMKEISVAIPQAKEVLAAKLGRMPKTNELAEHLKITEEELLKAMESSMAYGAFSLNQTFEEEGEGKESPTLEKFTAREEIGYRKLENMEIIYAVLDTLTETNRYIFNKRFLEEKSQAEIAKELGVSQMTISRAEKNIKERFAKELQR